MFAIYRDFSMLTSLPPTQPTNLKVENVHNLGIFQPIWLKLDIQSLNGRTQYKYLICKDLTLSMLTGQTETYHPTSLEAKSEKLA